MNKQFYPPSSVTRGGWLRRVSRGFRSHHRGKVRYNQYDPDWSMWKPGNRPGP